MTHWLTHCGETERETETLTTDLWLGGIDLVLLIQDGGVDDENVPDRWKRHRKDPSCVVGEHRHCCPLGIRSPIPLSLLGDVETVSLVWDWEAMDGSRC